MHGGKDNMHDPGGASTPCGRCAEGVTRPRQDQANIGKPTLPEDKKGTSPYNSHSQQDFIRRVALASILSLVEYGGVRPGLFI